MNPQPKQTFEINNKVKKISKIVLDEMTKRHYPSVSFMGLTHAIEKQGYTHTDILRAYAFLSGNKLINVVRKDPITSSFIELLDENGIRIKHTMISGYSDFMYGIIFYDARSNYENPISCHDHLDEQVKQIKEIIDEKCVKCFNERSQMICYLHDQSLEFCEKCKNLAELHKIQAENNKDFGKVEDHYITKILKDHNMRYWAN